MARIVLSKGACPVCDRDVTRAVHYGEIAREVFQCPAHGRLEYSMHHVPLSAMGHGGAVDVPLDLHRSQPLTGIELVC